MREILGIAQKNSFWIMENDDLIKCFKKTIFMNMVREDVVLLWNVFLEYGMFGVEIYDLFSRNEAWNWRSILV